MAVAPLHPRTPPLASPPRLSPASRGPSQIAFSRDPEAGTVDIEFALHDGLREDYGIPRKSIKAQAYWVA